jgi:hypothetical protein
MSYFGTTKFIKLMTPSFDDYKSKAEDIYQDLTDATSPNSIFTRNNYWQVGNVYDSIIDYLQYAVTQGIKTQQEAQDLNKRVIAIYYSMDGCWYDDFCWWIIALLKSYTYPHLFYPADIATCRQIIGEAWAIVDKGRPGIPYSGGAARAFEVCDPKVYGTVKPKYEGGTWQYDIYTSRTPKYPCDSDHNNPIPVNGLTPPMLGPYQLSVINGLHLVTTQRMSNYRIIPRTAADRQCTFIKQWTGNAQNVDDNLLNPFNSGGRWGLIRERVGKYLDSSVPVTGYDPSNTCWGGDQGLFIGGLYDYYLATKDSYCLSLLLKILTGVKEQMVTPFSKIGLSFNAIYSWSGGKDTIYIPDGPMSTDPADYSSGLGVFMRYLYYVCQDSSIRIGIINDPVYRNLIYQTAQACFYDAYPTVSEEVPMFRQFNRLAGLLAAIRILPSGNEAAGQ